MNTFVPIGLTESISVPNVPAGRYRIWVHGVNASGDGPNSSPVDVIVPGTCTGIPGAPTHFVATKSGNTISLNWDLPPAGPAPTGFLVNVSGTFAGSFPVTGRSLSGSVGLGSYSIALRSQNSCGLSVPATPVTVVVP